MAAVSSSTRGDGDDAGLTHRQKIPFKPPQLSRINAREWLDIVELFAEYQSMEHALEAAVGETVAGRVVKAEESKLLLTFMRVHMPTSMRALFKSCASAHELMQGVRRMFANSANAGQASQLLADIVGATQDHKESVVDFYCRLVDMNENLANADVDSALTDFEMVSNLLRGVRDEYSPAVAAIRQTLTKTPDVPLVLSQLRMVELGKGRVRSGNRGDEAMVVSKDRKAGRKPPACFFCGQVGHLQKDCPLYAVAAEKARGGKTAPSREKPMMSF